METSYGRLYLVATPVGNLEDITLRALRILKEVDLIAAEDTRRTIKLLNYFQIKKKMVSYHKYNERQQAKIIIEKLHTGMNIALVSDAGMPGISDPGNYLVREAIRGGIRVVPIPGPSAVIAALAASGLDTSLFLFAGFLPRKKQEQQDYLRTLLGFRGTLVFYEAPHRVIETLKNIRAVFGNRYMVLARELTKIHEEFLRDEIDNLIITVSERPNLGEFTILLENFGENQNSTNFDFEHAFDHLATEGSTLKEELRLIAKKTGKSTKEIYRLYLESKNTI